MSRVREQTAAPRHQTRHATASSCRCARSRARRAAGSAGRFHELLRVAAVHDINVYLLDFPAFVMRENYLYERLAPLLTVHGVTVEQSSSAFAQVARPGLIHRF